MACLTNYFSYSITVTVAKLVYSNLRRHQTKAVLMAILNVNFCWKITKDCRLSFNYLDRLGFGLEVEQFCFNIITCTFRIVFQVWCRGTRWIEGSSKHKRGLGLEKEIPRVIILEFLLFSKIVIYKLCQSLPNIKQLLKEINTYIYTCTFKCYFYRVNKSRSALV